MVRLQESVEKDDFEVVVELEKCAQEIAFVPCASLIDPFFGILEREEHIMEMNQDACFQRR